MTAEHNDELLPNGQDSVMVYFNPELLQSLADLSAEKRQNFQELLSAAEDGDGFTFHIIVSLTLPM